MKNILLITALTLCTTGCVVGPPYENGRERNYTDGRDGDPRDNPSNYYTGYNADRSHDHDRHTDDTWLGNNNDGHRDDDGYYDSHGIWHEYRD